MVIEQIKNQLDRLVPVHRVVDMTLAGNSIERELAMVKVRGKGEHRVEALRLADAFRARVIDATTESFVFEITGKSDKIEQFIELMLPLGLVEVSRTGIAAIARGPEGMCGPLDADADSVHQSRLGQDHHAAGAHHQRPMVCGAAFNNGWDLIRADAEMTATASDATHIWLSHRASRPLLDCVFQGDAQPRLARAVPENRRWPGGGFSARARFRGR